ncbi:MAG: hypothetical protein PHS32_10105, partial [Rhodoferax sp.]|uniref:hypothetical protein n=1 Tax=Rhodoferax sp. TaxID=50421 RepID=UPI00262602BB
HDKDQSLHHKRRHGLPLCKSSTYAQPKIQFPGKQRRVEKDGLASVSADPEFSVKYKAHFLLGATDVRQPS